MRIPARCWLAAASLLAAAGCARVPDSYPSPEQHEPFRTAVSSSTEFANFADPLTSSFIVKDVLGTEAGPWRWTRAEPELKFVLSSTHNRTLYCEFSINERTFQDTGPVTISFYVNGGRAGEETYTSTGDKQFEKLIPPDWLRAGEETRVLIRVHNVFKNPDGSVLGVLLRRAGFIE